MTKRGILIMMIVPAVISLALGVVLVMVTRTQFEGDQSGLEYGMNILMYGGLFAVSLVITLVYLLAGLARLRKLREK